MAPMAAAAIVAILAVERATVAARAALSVAPVHAERPVSIGQRGLEGRDEAEFEAQGQSCSPSGAPRK